jgi:uncharacterized membrane protein
MIALSDTGSLIGGFFGLILALVLLVVAICWLVFPFIVANSLGRIEKLLRQQTDRQNETNRALQFLVNKK